MAKKSFKAKEPIKIRFKKLRNGNNSIYLDYWDGSTQTRKYEFLKLYLIPDTLPDAREQNEHTLMVANTIKNDRLRGLVDGKAGIEDNSSKGKILFKDFANQYIENPKTKLAKKTIAIYKSVLMALSKFNDDLQLKDFNRKQLQNFIEFLRGYGITPASQTIYLAKIGKILKVAFKEGLIKSNPMLEIDSDEKPKAHTPKRAYLERNEIKQLQATPLNERIKKPFLFSCFCGLRLVDIKALKWTDIKVVNGQKSIEIIQQKTNELVLIPLSNEALKYLPEQQQGKENVFDMYDDTWTNQKVKKWAKLAGINKNVTFHTARHTFATISLTAGVDLYTTSKMLGHTDIKTTQIYAEIVNKKKQEATKLVDNFMND